MPSERYYVDQLTQNQTVLEGLEFHHFLHVMRNVEGNEVEVTDGKGALAIAKVHSIEKKRAILQIVECTHRPPPSSPIILAQGIPRFNRLENILEKGTELGMTEIWLFPSSNSEKKEFSDHQLERMQTITIAAMKQCGRLYLPKILFQPPLKQWVKPTLSSYFGDLSPEAPPFSKIWQSHSQGSLFFVGPESGFTLDEIQCLRSLALGVKLNSNILRTDTAAISALSLITHLEMG